MTDRLPMADRFTELACLLEAGRQRYRAAQAQEITRESGELCPVCRGFGRTEVWDGGRVVGITRCLACS